MQVNQVHDAALSSNNLGVLVYMQALTSVHQKTIIKIWKSSFFILVDFRIFQQTFS